MYPEADLIPKAVSGLSRDWRLSGEERFLEQLINL
jgi:hypothetical protein